MCLFRATILTITIFSLCNSAWAQQTAQPPQNCSDVDGVPFGNATLNGIWYEIARNPAPSTAVGCVQLDVNATSTNLYVNVTASNQPTAWYNNSTTNANLTLYTANNTLNYTFMGSSQPSIVKLLTFNTNYAMICAYNSDTDNSTSFGIVLTRQRSASLSVLSPNDTSKYNNFVNIANFYNLTQSAACYTQTGNGASVAAMPFMTAIFAAIYAVLKLANLI